jgi:flagellar assembly protein FliH
MSSIIRAADRGACTQTVAFNFDDMSSQAERYLNQVRAEAAKIVAEAQREAEAVRRQAELDGREAAMQAVDQMVARRLATVLPALRQAIEEIRQAKHAWLKHWEAGAVHLAAAMAARVVRRELKTQPEIPLELVREGLELAAGAGSLRIHLNPQDREALGDQVEGLLKEFATLASTELAADPAITPGGCRIETRFGVIDQQFEAQLRRIEEELT